MSQDDPVTEAAESVMRRWLIWAVLVLVILLLALLAVWTQRTPIADNLIGRELARRDVSGRYEVAGIGLRTQRLENVVLGPRDRPDLSADWVEVDISVSAFSPRVTAIRAGGVRLRGQIIDGQLQLGELDKFRDPTSAEPLGLPDLNLSVYDARMRLDTPAGPVGIKLDGKGQLRSGFKGKLAAIMPAAALDGCRASDLALYSDISVTAQQPRLRGPLRIGAVNCADADLSLVKPAADLDVRLNEALDHWRGEAGMTADTLSRGDMKLSALGGQITFNGDSQAMQGRLDLSASAVALPSLRSGRTQVEGSWATGSDQQGGFARLQGAAQITTLQMTSRNPLQGLRQASAGTPIEPLAIKLVSAIEAAGRQNEARATFAVRQRGNAGRLQVTDLAFQSRSGARVVLAGRADVARRQSPPRGRGASGGGDPASAKWPGRDTWRSDFHAELFRRQCKAGVDAGTLCRERKGRDPLYDGGAPGRPFAGRRRQEFDLARGRAAGASRWRSDQHGLHAGFLSGAEI
jgi:hypothetical protein